MEPRRVDNQENESGRGIQNARNVRKLGLILCGMPWWFFKRKKMSPLPSLTPAEYQIANAFLLAPEIDPFGYITSEKKIKSWETAIAINVLFTRKTVTKGQTFGMGEMFYCKDCDAFMKCSNHGHSSYIRCFGGNGEHCLECN